MNTNIITVDIAQLKYENANNPFHNRKPKELQQYLTEFKHFKVQAKPMVYKSYWEGEYLVLSNVADVIAAKESGQKQIEVIELIDVSQEEAERFSLHREYFMSLSEESKYLQLKKLFRILRTNKEWADSIVVPGNKTWSKVALVAHYSTGSIDTLIRIGDADFSMLKKIDDGTISKASAFRQLFLNSKGAKHSEGENLKTHNKRKNQPRIIPVNRVEGKGQLLMPSQDFNFCIEARHGELNQPFGILKLNNVSYTGVLKHEDLGAGFSSIHFISGDGIEVTMKGYELDDTFHKAGFNTEPQPRKKLQTGLKKNK